MPRTTIQLTIALVLLLLAACEEAPPQVLNRREAKPPPGSGGSGDICVIVRRSPSPGGSNSNHGNGRVSGYPVTRVTSFACPASSMAPTRFRSLVLTNFLTLPLFSCYTRHDRSIDVYARRNGDGWLYNATCQW